MARSQDPTSVGFMESIYRLKFRMSFDVCKEGYNVVVDGIPALPLDTKTTINERGIKVINNSINNMFPRRIWDICANTVIPTSWFWGPPCPLTGRQGVGAVGVMPVSHAWAAPKDRTFIITEANQHMWPVPLPRGVLLEDVRGEMIRLGVRYAWVDVLCLRQEAEPKFATGLIILARSEDIKRREDRRSEEWEIDLPAMGAIYLNPDKDGLYGGAPTVIFMSGLGCPFRDEGWDNKRHWLKRAWTLQEAPVLSRCLIAGLPGGPEYQWYNPYDGGRKRPWNYKVCYILSQIHDIKHFTPYLASSDNGTKL